MTMWFLTSAFPTLSTLASLIILSLLTKSHIRINLIDSSVGTFIHPIIWFYQNICHLQIVPMKTAPLLNNTIEMRVLWKKIKYLKSTTRLLSKDCVNKGGSNLLCPCRQADRQNFFSNLQLWWLVSLLPFYLQRPTIPLNCKNRSKTFWVQSDPTKNIL